jgi:putative spermidine/putrescine transport system ATP-binding protein
MTVTAIGLRGITKKFGETRACDAIDLDVRSGEFLTLLGDSGCGKTTLLRVIAGFIRPDAGVVMLGGDDITHRPAADRSMGFVFQSYALFPTKTVAQNIGFALEIQGQAAAKRAQRVMELAQLMELQDLLARFPHELSGGQQQRVALARALAPAPKVLLLDEPLSALDARIRARLRQELRGLVRRLGLTAIYVTHDQDEALALSDRVAVMRAGRIEQIDTPQAVYQRPVNEFIGRFVGVSTIIAGRVGMTGNALEGLPWPLPPGHDLAAGVEVRVLFRPEAIDLAPIECGCEPTGIIGTLRSAVFLGGFHRLEIEVEGQSVIVDRPSSQAVPPDGTRLQLRPDPQLAIVLAGELA